MPRRNRRSPAHPVRVPLILSNAQLRSLRLFAADHLMGHALAVERAEDGDVVMSGSEHPGTGTRFMSVGNRLDARAMRLSEGVYASDAGVKVGE